MAQSIASMFRDGQDYMHEWPMQKQLYALFPECRVIAATKFGLKVMPPVAVLAAITMVNQMGTSYLPQAIAVAAFFISLPMQGLLWLGNRANQPLPPSVSAWYREIHAKMRSQGLALQAVKSRPRYKELATLLKTAFNELDRVFTKQWF
ncbi:terminus macrodomain insulation protein YfbV [Aestuariibacter salexigens]|uniref:terminus macrodomain insulation protein YfbV n=1 Tax=Aestuariibacter salexigens TaxID=226010 RepID=UPI0004107AC9|nr:terminus macrodomain insulation protein YfbV [Aestuariibacter salexigens]